MKHISICIPTYEMHGKGSIFLRQSFERILEQTFKDFDIVISDNSTDTTIKDVCAEYVDKLTIIYTQNPDPQKGIVSNLNNSLQNATGKIIKILFQDDFFYSPKSLQIIADNFDLQKDKWVATACIHTKDGLSFEQPHYPSWNNNIHLGNNTIR